jgi:HlyD family secretion protein
MDVPRQGNRKRKTIRRIVILVAVLGVLGGGAWGVSRLQPALATVEAASVWPDTVARGPMVRQVHGVGSLVPQDVIWISAQVDGRIEKINIQPGTEVREDTIIMELSNPTLDEGMVAAEYDLKQAQAAYTDLKVTLQSNRFDKESNAAQITSDYEQARIKAERDQQLADQGLIPSIDLKLSVAQARDLQRRNEIEQKRLGIIDESSEAQLAAQKVKIEKYKAIYDLKKQQVDELHVHAGVPGMLQQLGNSTVTNAPPLEVGQNVTAGSILARIAQQNRLKAQIRISETEARDIALNQPAVIDTHNGTIPGKVSRMDPAAINGTVLVDVALLGALPAGARPDLSVDGTIEIERLNDVVFVGRPASAQPNGSGTVFRLDPDGKTATHVKVKFGRASVNTIEILEGLRVGEKIILSDMSTVESHDRIRLN